MREKIVLIGAGSTNFGLGTVSDIFKSKVFDGCTIILHDINKESLNIHKILKTSLKKKIKLT